MPLPERLEFFRRIMSGVHRGWLTSFERKARNEAALGMIPTPPEAIAAQQQMMWAKYAQDVANYPRNYPQGGVFSGIGNLGASLFDP
jgi:hypothetical protein